MEESSGHSGFQRLPLELVCAICGLLCMADLLSLRRVCRIARAAAEEDGRLRFLEYCTNKKQPITSAVCGTLHDGIVKMAVRADGRVYCGHSGGTVTILNPDLSLHSAVGLIDSISMLVLGVNNDVVIKMLCVPLRVYSPCLTMVKREYNLQAVCDVVASGDDRYLILTEFALHEYHGSEEVKRCAFWEYPTTMAIHNNKAYISLIFAKLSVVDLSTFEVCDSLPKTDPTTLRSIHIVNGVMYYSSFNGGAYALDMATSKVESVDTRVAYMTSHHGDLVRVCLDSVCTPYMVFRLLRGQRPHCVVSTSPFTEDKRSALYISTAHRVIKFDM